MRLKNWVTQKQLLARIAQVAFWCALLFTFFEAVIPAGEAIPLFPWDKAQHFTAFYGLTGLAVAGYPRRNLFTIGLALSGFGILIELVQALPFVQRDCDFWDWVADTIAIAAAMAPMLLVWWRGEFRQA
jgi:hypothetical protein